MTNQTPSSIPSCEYCGSERTFELQILPTLILDLKPLYPLENPKISNESGEEKVKQIIQQTTPLDYGVVSIFSCSTGCSSSKFNFMKEYIYVQHSL